VKLTVTDNGGGTGTVTHPVTIRAAQTIATESTAPTPPPTPAPTPNSGFAGHASFNTKTGAITVVVTVSDPGRFSWLATFANGKFGVFASRATKCKAGQIRLGGRCRPARITFGKGSKTVAAGPVTF